MEPKGWSVAWLLGKGFHRQCLLLRYPVIAVLISPKLQRFQVDFGWISINPNDSSQDILEKIEQALSSQNELKKKILTGKILHFERSKIIYQFLKKRLESLR